VTSYCLINVEDVFDDHMFVKELLGTELGSRLQLVPPATFIVEALYGIHKTSNIVGKNS
jgi:hypothetical protein